MRNRGSRRAVREQGVHLRRPLPCVNFEVLWWYPVCRLLYQLTIRELEHAVGVVRILVAVRYHYDGHALMVELRKELHDLRTVP